jgi:hypothetical protein
VSTALARGEMVGSSMTYLGLSSPEVLDFAASEPVGAPVSDMMKVGSKIGVVGIGVSSVGWVELLRVECDCRIEGGKRRSERKGGLLYGALRVVQVTLQGRSKLWILT